MSYLHHKNSILTGAADAFCLLCESHLKTQDDINNHIEKPVHKKNLDSVPYFEKYKNDHIRKVKRGYYCEFCNVLCPTAAKVGLHLEENNHKQHKGSYLLKRIENGLTAFENLFIDEKAWHGLLEETCLICNIEFENESIHKTSPAHVINLIQSKIEFEENAVYRMIDGSSFQCLTCNSPFALSTQAGHSQDTDHVKGVEKCRRVSNGAIKKSTNNLSSSGNKKDIKETVTENKIKQNNDNKENIEVNKEELDTAKDVPGNKTKILTTKDHEAIENAVCKVLGSKDYILREEGELSCILCDWPLKPGLGVMNHLESQHHLTLKKMHLKRLEEIKKAKQNLDDIVCSEKSTTTSANENTSNVQDQKQVLRQNNVNINTKTKKDESESGSKQKSTLTDEEAGKIQDNQQEFLQSNMNINMKTKKAYCKQCSININFKFNDISNHIKDHKKKSTKTTAIQTPVSENVIQQDVKSRTSSLSSRDDDEIEKFSKDHNLQYDRDGVYCYLCNAQLPISLKSVKEHVDGGQHKLKMKAAATSVDQKPQSLVKVPVYEFCKSIDLVKHADIVFVVINNTICVNVLSFYGLARYGQKVYCPACDIYLHLGQVQRHMLLQTHLTLIREAMLVTSFDSEFVREVRAEVLHCGFCNIHENGRKGMEAHLKTNSHREAKNMANWHLAEFQPNISRFGGPEVMDFNSFLKFSCGYS